MKGRKIPLWVNIILISLAVVLVVAVLFVGYCGISSACTGTGFAETISDTWCAIFGLAETVTETTQEAVEPVVEAII